jgi:phosphoribosylanthranilate isomerase
VFCTRCGHPNRDDARFCAAAGADYLGFIQYPKSPRYISAQDARDIIEEVQEWIMEAASQAQALQRQVRLAAQPGVFRQAFEVTQLVMRGLDPRIHQRSKVF